MRPRLSLCMIVKDEEQLLDRCLRSVAGVADEIVVVDTGSTDRTVAIATAHGAVIRHHPWDGSFSSARNCSLDAATGDWVLILDADEVLTRGELVRAAIEQAPDEIEAYILPIVNFVGERAHEEAVTAPSVRVFRLRPTYRFTRALHEQIMFAIYEQRPEAKVGFVDAPLEHYGYLNHVVADRDKIHRNLEIARQEVERYPDDAFSWYNLGQEHFRLGEWEQAIEAYQTGFPYLSSLVAGFAPALVKHLLVCLLNLGRTDDVLSVAADAKEAYPEFTDLWVLSGLACLRAGRHAEAVEQFSEALVLGEVAGSYYMSDEGVGSYKANWWLGHAWLHLDRLDRAQACFLESLAEVTRRRRYLVPPIDGLLQVFRLRNVSDEAVHQVLADHVDLADPRWRELVARRLLALGWNRPAGELYDQLESAADETRLVFGQAFLRAGDVARAQAAFAAVAADSPSRAEADWHQFLALAVAGDTAGAEALFTGSIAQGGEAEMVRFYGALLQLWSGLPEAAVPAPELEHGQALLQGNLSSLLELLLATERYELFGRSLPALTWVGLSGALQAVFLGRLYHAAGLHDMAFDALLLAVEEGVRDHETLRLLGLLCLRRGAYAEAEELLGEVVRHQDPQAASWTVGNTALLGYLSALSAQGKDREADPLWQKLTHPQSTTAMAAA